MPISNDPLNSLSGSNQGSDQNYDQRMRRQFAIPDPAVFEPKKRSASGPTREDSSGAPGEVRYSVPYSTYKTGDSGTATAGDGGGLTKGQQARAAERAAKDVAKQRAREDSQRKKLMGDKEYLLKTLCTDPGVQPGDSRIYSTMGQVTEINQKLGLPVYDTGSWGIPK